MPKRKSKSPYARPDRQPDAQPEGQSLRDEGPKLSAQDVAMVVKEVVPQVVEALKPSMIAPRDTPPQAAEPGDRIDEGRLTSIDMELGLTIPLNLRQKIVNGEYVELGLLLDKTGKEESVKKLACIDGQVIVQPKQNTRINDIQQWTDAMLVYTSIYSAAHPESNQGLLKYIHNVRLGARRFGGSGWMNYDTQFRLKKAQDPTASWSLVDHELWLLYMNTPSLQTPSLGRKCYDFNKGWCNRSPCSYLHKCLRCAGNHQLLRCTLKTGQQSAIVSGFRPTGAQQTRYLAPTSATRAAANRHQFRYQGPRPHAN